MRRMKCLLYYAQVLLLIYKCAEGSEPTCFQEETKLEGTKLDRRPRIGEEFSVDNCQLLCNETLDCISWTLIGGKLPDCLLFSEVKNVTNQKDATSGPKVCSGSRNGFEKELTQEQSSCILKSTAIRGDQLGEKFSSTSLKNCKTKCQTSDECNFWTFFKRQKTCAHFSTVKRKVPRSGAKSGPKNCSEFTAENQTFSSRNNDLAPCYKDNPNRILPYEFIQSKQMTINMCKLHCLEKNYIYAGVQYYQQCFCGNDKPDKSLIRNPEECNTPCLGNLETEICGGVWRMNIYKGSFLTTPGYPSKYGNNVHKIWTIKAPAGYKVINFKFVDFELESEYQSLCKWDSVKIVDSNGVTIMPKRCGSSNPGIFRSQTNQASVYFDTDGSVVERGFKLELSFDYQAYHLPCYCGLRKTRTNRIVGGTETEVNEYPWMARLESNGVFFCGGSLLNSKWVMSAAHCTFSEKASELRVILGDHSRRDKNEADDISIRVSKIINHPHYRNGSLNYDFSLLELSAPVDFLAKPHIRPICLPTSLYNMYTGNTATVTGWGHTAFGGKTSDVLREADVTVISNSVCSKSYAITSKMICAADSGKDSCQGDSGGPLVTTAGDGVSPGQNYELIGVVSGGEECALPDYPGIYARVTSELDWIKLNIGGGEFCPREIADMFVESSGDAQTYQSSKLGTYTYDDTQVIHGKPVWKSTKNLNLLYFDKYGAWRIGKKPNWGGITSNWNWHESLPDGSVNNGGWYYWNYKSWKSDRTLKITGVPKSSRRMEQEKEGHGTSSGDSESDSEIPIEPSTSQNITKPIFKI